MEKFNLQKYLEKPSRKLVTRDGRKARIVCTDMRCANYPIVALVLISDNHPTEDVWTYTKDGEYEVDKSTRHDLFFAPEKHEGWINIYEDMGNRKYTGIYDTKAEAEDRLSPEGCYLTTIKIEWEE